MLETLRPAHIFVGGDMLVNRKEFLKSLAWTSKFNDKVAIFSDPNSLTVVGANPDIIAISKLLSHGPDEWVAFISPKKLTKYLNQLTDEVVELGFEEGAFTASTGNGSATEPNQGPAPEIPLDQDYGPSVTIHNLAESMEKVVFAIDEELPRTAPQKALIRIDGHESHLVATDRHRMSIAPLRVEGDQKIIACIPPYAAREVSKITGSCQLSADENSVSIDWGSRKLIISKADSTFIDYKRITPKDATDYVAVNREQILKAVEQVKVYAEDRANSVNFEFSNEQVKVHTSTSGSKSQAHVPCVKASTAGLTTCFNAEYITDFLQRAETEHIAFCFKRVPGYPVNEKAGVLLSGEGWQYIVMPLRVK
jgi:DNA polymerase-3 subunit beta